MASMLKLLAIFHFNVCVKRTMRSLRMLSDSWLLVLSAEVLFFR